MASLHSVPLVLNNKKFKIGWLHHRGSKPPFYQNFESKVGFHFLFCNCHVVFRALAGSLQLGQSAGTPDGCDVNLHHHDMCRTNGSCRLLGLLLSLAKSEGNFCMILSTIGSDFAFGLPPPF